MASSLEVKSEFVKLDLLCFHSSKDFSFAATYLNAHKVEFVPLNFKFFHFPA
ncbi:hypothetical protein HMPREF0308_2152 [Corynebacterium striatum ATCC 6940]|nr:hypothetical protein HMPREF0308_2152 [Corynebacterium striatum ATCC 6940]